jgi:hypothetical protein
MNGIRDEEAAVMLTELREELGLMPRDLPHLMRKAGIPRDRIPSERTLWRAEAGVRPQLRHRKAIATFYGVPMANIWEPRVREFA